MFSMFFTAINRTILKKNSNSLEKSSIALNFNCPDVYGPCIFYLIFITCFTVFADLLHCFGTILDSFSFLGK